MTNEEEILNHEDRKRFPLLWGAVGLFVIIATFSVVWVTFFSGHESLFFSLEGERVYKAKEVWQVFEDDPQFAKKEYIGRTIAVSGVVVETGMSIYMTPNVMLSDSAEGKRYAVCVLPRADSGKLSHFNKGQRVVFYGRVYRAIPEGEGVVYKDCQLMGGDSEM